MAWGILREEGVGGSVNGGGQRKESLGDVCVGGGGQQLG